MALATKRRTPEPPSLNDVYEGERQLVGLILAHPEVYPALARILRREDWTQSLHRGVFEAAGDLAAAGQPITPGTVLPRIGDVGPDGAPADAYLAELVAVAPPSHHAEGIARRLAEAARAQQRRSIYDLDVYAWAFAQAQHLRRGQFSALDALNLAEEIEDLGNEIYNTLESALRITLMHLLKWDHQPGKRSRSWTLSIRNGRMDAAKILAKHPSLRPRLPSALAEAYRRARIDAAGETGLDEDTFPADCPYDLDAVMNRPIPWPPTKEP